jgi:molecular chaperone GrpE
MNGDSNGTRPDDNGDASSTDSAAASASTIPIEVITGEVAEPSAGSSDAATEVAQLLQRIDALEIEKKEYWDKLLRTAADLENLRKRQRREVDEARLDTKSRVLKEILPVVDNLERALTVTANDGAAVLDGVRLVQRQFLQALERLEVTPIEAERQPFDPNLHEAISQQESDEHPAGTVMTVLQRGFKAGDRLLRPSLVVVAKAKAG